MAHRVGEQTSVFHGIKASPNSRLKNDIKELKFLASQSPLPTVLGSQHLLFQGSSQPGALGESCFFSKSRYESQRKTPTGSVLWCAHRSSVVQYHLPRTRAHDGTSTKSMMRPAGAVLRKREMRKLTGLGGGWQKQNRKTLNTVVHCTLQTSLNDSLESESQKTMHLGNLVLNSEMQCPHVAHCY